MPDWWEPALKSALSQGDVLSAVPLGAPAFPTRPLKKGPTNKDQQAVWHEQDEWFGDPDGIGHYLGRGRFAAALVVTHDCELDKSQTKRVLVAPIASISHLQPSHRDTILRGERIPFLALDGVPEIGTGYADLRHIVSMEMRTIQSLTRLKSMAEDGVLRLQAQLLAFFTYRNLPGPPGGAAAPAQ